MFTLLLDRDGVLIPEMEYEYHPQNIRLLPGVAEGLRKLKGHWQFFVVTNQSAIGRGLDTHENVQACNQRLIELLNEKGVDIREIVYCPHHPDDQCDCRKPKLGMWQLLMDKYDLRQEECVMVGNRESDMQFGRNIGCRTVFVKGRDELFAVPPNAVIETLDVLPAILQKLKEQQ